MDGVVFEGRIDELECDQCRGFVIYHAEYDAFFYPLCRVWKERPCTDRECECCRSRPSLPPGVEDILGD